MKKFTTYACGLTLMMGGLLTSQQADAQFVFSPSGQVPISFQATFGDKISLYGDRIDDANNYGMGVNSNTMYFKSNGHYIWLQQENYNSVDISTAMVLNSAGKLGLGYRYPQASLHVYDGTDAKLSSASNGYLILGDHQNLNMVLDDNEIMARDYSSFPNTSTLYLNREGGTVNINTGAINANYALMVGGAIRAEEIKVETGWADFVFEDDYALRSLSEVASYIDEHGHLPEIPSAETVEAEGVNLGEMESKLLMKIEELTLYMIELDKSVEALKQENESLKALIPQD